MTNEERVTPAPVDLAAVEALPGERGPGTEIVLTPAERDALTKALRIAVEALRWNERVIHASDNGPGECTAPPCEALRAISSLVVIR